VTGRSKLNGLCAAFVISLVLAGACTDNEPSRILEQSHSEDSGTGNAGSGNRPTGGRGGTGASSGGTDGGPGPDECLVNNCADPDACTAEEQMAVDICRINARRCPDQPVDVLMERQPGEQIPAGPEVPSTPTRPQLSEAEADELYTIEHALRGGGVYMVSYTGSGDTGAGGAGGASAGEPLGERTVTYASEDDWDPTGPIEDVRKILPGVLVDPETGGDSPDDDVFPTIQAAITAAVNVAGCPRVFIKVSPGTYREKITVPAKTSTPPVTLYGVDRDPGRVVIVNGHSAAGEQKLGLDPPCGDPLSVHASATFTNSLPQPFQARNLTIQNDYVAGTCPSASPDAQTAVALLSQADKALFDNVRILGHRNALYVKSTGANEVSRVYFRNSYIEGDEDMILGRGAAVVDQSRIHSLGDRVTSGAITAPSTRVDNPHGILIINSELTADANVSNVYLGSTWYEGNAEEAVGKTVVRNSILGAHIRLDDVWAPTTRSTPKNPTPSSVVLYTSDDYYVPGSGLIPPEIYLAEFGNSGPGAAAAEELR
jgi:pectinesterase